MRNYISKICYSMLLVLSLFNSVAYADTSISVPILTYHNFEPSESGSMIISTSKFEAQLKWLIENGYTVIPMKNLVSYLRGGDISIPAKSVVICTDDGRKSVYLHMLPIVRKYNIPVTLFVYPSSISNASYAMTWDQLRELQKTNLFDIQSHTYWHPNFKQEKKKLSASEYEKLVNTQFVSSKKTLDEKLKTNVTLLAWPFGIYDEYLEQQAAKAGYVMAFSIDPRPASKSENMMSQPRYLMVEGQSMQAFAAMINKK